MILNGGKYILNNRQLMARIFYLNFEVFCFYSLISKEKNNLFKQHFTTIWINIIKFSYYKASENITEYKF